ncbi:MAG: carboxypeptidase regulatory-like domain-containing protein, partial [Terriglobia bacterium]
IAGFPHPKLMALDPGGNATENVVIHAVPAALKSSTGSAPLWGAYSMSVAYSASYPNGGELRKSLGVDLWAGSVSSNAVEITLRAPGESPAGFISGKVVNHEGLAEAGILVSLTDNDEHLLEQAVTGFDGGFRFDHLPFGRYWVTVRRLGADDDTSFFEHADLSSAQPDAQMKLIMLNQEVYEAKHVLHKPVLFRITDDAGNPVADAEIKLLWSNGPVIENAKIETDGNGLALIDLIPGSNYVTITKHHCPKVDQLANVAPGGGIDGFSITFNCGKR